MTIELRSFDRAHQAAQFFGPLLGPRVVLRRLRVLNRCIDADEMTDGAEQFDRLLDQKVTVIDPRVTEARVKKLLAGVTSQEEAVRRLERDREERRRAGDDIPLVEDMPLAP